MVKAFIASGPFKYHDTTHTQIRDTHILDMYILADVHNNILITLSGTGYTWSVSSALFF